MARRYDSRTTTFSPEGRLFQVEYAMEAIAHAGLSIGILASTGIVLAAERKQLSPLLEPNQASQEKIYKIDDHVAAIVAGMTADAAILIQHARAAAQAYRRTFAAPMPLELLVQRLGNIKQGYTQMGGLRPFGVSLVWAGFSEREAQFELYVSDPSGNYAAWKAIAVGNGSASATSVLKGEYSEGMSLEEAKTLALHALRKAVGQDTESLLRAEAVELTVLEKAPSGAFCIRPLSSTEIFQAIAAAAAAVHTDMDDSSQSPGGGSPSSASEAFSTTVS